MNDSPPIETKDNTTAHADASRRLMHAAASEDNHNMGNKTSSVFITTLALNTPESSPIYAKIPLYKQYEIRHQKQK